MLKVLVCLLLMLQTINLDVGDAYDIYKQGKHVRLVVRDIPDPNSLKGVNVIADIDGKRYDLGGIAFYPAGKSMSVVMDIEKIFKQLDNKPKTIKVYCYSGKELWKFGGFYFNTDKIEKRDIFDLKRVYQANLNKEIVSITVRGIKNSNNNDEVNVGIKIDGKYYELGKAHFYPADVKSTSVIYDMNKVLDKLKGEPKKAEVICTDKNGKRVEHSDYLFDIEK